MSLDLVMALLLFSSPLLWLAGNIVDDALKQRRNEKTWLAMLDDPLLKPALLLHENHETTLRLLGRTGDLTHENGPFSLRLTCRMAHLVLEVRKSGIEIATFRATRSRGDVATDWSEEADALSDDLKLRIAALAEEAIGTMTAAADAGIRGAVSDLAEALYVHAPEPKAPAPVTDQTARLDAIRRLCDRAAGTKDAELAAVARALSSTIGRIAERLAADPENEKALAPLLDYAVPKARDLLAAYLRLTQEGGLSAAESASLEPVRHTLMKLPRLFEDHLALARSSDITALLDQRDSFEAIALVLDRPVAAPAHAT